MIHHVSLKDLIDHQFSLLCTMSVQCEEIDIKTVLLTDLASYHITVMVLILYQVNHF